MGDKRIKKGEYFDKLNQLLEEYPTIFIVNVDNVGSNQMHQVRLEFIYLNRNGKGMTLLIRVQCRFE